MSLHLAPIKFRDACAAPVGVARTVTCCSTTGHDAGAAVTPVPQAWWEARAGRRFERAAAKRYRRMVRPGRRRQGRYRACQHASRRPNSDCPGAQICNDCGIGIIHRRARVDFLVRDAIRDGRPEP